MTPERSRKNSNASLIVDPLAISALVLLVTNDNWLKPAWHNEVSGKLSDVAVCLLLPLFLTELLTPCTRWTTQLRILDIAAIATAVVYTTLELSGTAALWTCDVLGRIGPWLAIDRPFVMTRDLTDLWALLAIIPAWIHGRRRIVNQQERSLAPAGKTIGAALASLCLIAPQPAAAASKLFERTCSGSSDPARAETIRCNDGFFVRAMGHLSLDQINVREVTVDGPESYTRRVSAHGVGMGYDLTLGGTPAKGVLIGGFIGFRQYGNYQVTVVEGGTAEPGILYESRIKVGALERITFGPALILYPSPLQGWVIDLRPTIGGLDFGAPVDISGASYGFQFGAGHELWLTPNWGLGLSVRVELAKVRENLAVKRGPDFTDGTFGSAGLAVSLTMH